MKSGQKGRRLFSIFISGPYVCYGQAPASHYGLEAQRQARQGIRQGAVSDKSLIPYGSRRKEGEKPEALLQVGALHDSLAFRG